MRVAGDVDQQIAKEAVHQPRWTLARLPLQQAKGDFEFVDGVGPGLVDARRLAGGSDKDAGEQIRQRGMIEPVADKALEQIGPAEERAVGRRGSAHHQMIAAAGAGVPPVQHEFLRAQPALSRFGVERGGVGHQLTPTGRRNHVDLNHAGIGRNLDLAKPGIVRRRVAFNDHRELQAGGGIFHRSEQIQVIFGARHGREKHAELALPRFHGQRGSHGAFRRGSLRSLGRLRILALPRTDGALRHVRFQPALLHASGRRQRGPGRHRVHQPDGLRRTGGQALQRQPVTHGRIAGHQKKMTRAEHPQAGLPLGAALALGALQRKHEAGWIAQAPAEDTAQALTLFRVIQLVVERIDIDRQQAFLVDIGERVFVRGNHVLGADGETIGQRFGEGLGLGLAHAVIPIRNREQRRIAPKRVAILTPVAGEGPARQRFAGIPFALPRMQQRARGEFLAQAADQISGEAALGRAHGGGIPFLAIHIVDRDKRGFAAHGEADISGNQFVVDAVSQFEDALPLLVRVRLGDARVFMNPRDAHGVVKLNLARADYA